MFIQTQNIKSKFIKVFTCRKVSNVDSLEFINIDDTDNSLIKNILSINGVQSIFLGSEFVTLIKMII